MVAGKLEAQTVGTVNKQIADDVIAGKYAFDNPRKIVKYLNAWGGESYGLICAHEPLDKYKASDFVKNPEIYWEHPSIRRA